jgi:hypothetical protein
MPGRPLRVLGLSELIKALNAVDRDLARALRASLKEAADFVAKDAGARLSELSPSPARSAAGVVPRVRNAGLVTVEQKLRRTTGKRPDWGATQMARAFLPAADADADQVAAMVETAIDSVAFSQGF